MPDAFEVDQIGRFPATPDEVVVRFTGSALAILEQLQVAMGLQRREEVVVQAVQLLYGALGKDVLYRDSRGAMETVRVWKA